MTYHNNHDVNLTFHTKFHMAFHIIWWCEKEDIISHKFHIIYHLYVKKNVKNNVKFLMQFTYASHVFHSIFTSSVFSLTRFNIAFPWFSLNFSIMIWNTWGTSQNFSVLNSPQRLLPSLLINDCIDQSETRLAEPGRLVWDWSKITMRIPVIQPWCGVRNLGSHTAGNRAYNKPSWEFQHP